METKGLMEKVAVLMMAYGGPNSLDDVEPYLLDVRGGRSTSPELVEEIRERYERIGGRSPLLDITQDQAAALQRALNNGTNGHAGKNGNGAGQATGQPDVEYRVYVGMRHWYPYIREAVSHIAQDGIWNVVALCMAPHSSKMSTGAYFQKLQEAQEALGARLNVTKIDSWNTHPGFIGALAQNITTARDRFGAGRDDVFFLFTAHSLPAAIIEQGDPYEAQLHETCGLLAERLGLPDDRWRFCYQSAGATSARWLGPAVEDVIADLAGSGHKNLMVAPVGFVADHVEVLYDIDVECCEVAEANGVHLERPESLNASPAFIAALADIVKKAL